MSAPRLRVLVGVTAGIAAYKTCDLVRELVRGEHEVQVVMTKSATKLVTPLTFSALSGRETLSEMFDDSRAHLIDHIELGRWAEAVVIAPATLDFIGRFAGGMAGDLLLATLFAMPHQTPVVWAPSMNTRMWEHPLFRANLERLQALNDSGFRYSFVDPSSKLLACRDEGKGALPDVGAILEALATSLDRPLSNLLSPDSSLIQAPPDTNPRSPS